MTSPGTTRPRTIDSDLDGQSPAADLVRVYLNGIGRTALLTAADEVDLARRIEAGLYAAHVLATKKRLTAAKNAISSRPSSGTARQHAATSWRPIVRLVVSLAKRYTGRGMPLLDLIRRATSA